MAENTFGIELTLRAAMVSKSVLQMVGTKDPHLARLMVLDAAEQLRGLHEFVKSADEKLAK